MKIKPIASSSKGTAYAIEAGGKTLLIEAGVPLKKIREVVPNLSEVVGCLISHSHGDHSKYIPNLERETDVPVYTIFEDRKHFFTPGLEFCIWPLKLNHDVECFGFLIRHKNKNLFYASDTSEVNYTIPGLTHLMIETNFSFEFIVESDRHKSLVKRIIENHLSLETAIEFIKRHKDLEEIHLLHLSDAHSDPELFKKAVQDEAGCIVKVAGVD